MCNCVCYLYSCDFLNLGIGFDSQLAVVLVHSRYNSGITPVGGFRTTIFFEIGCVLDFGDFRIVVVADF